MVHQQKKCPTPCSQSPESLTLKLLIQRNRGAGGKHAQLLFEELSNNKMVDGMPNHSFTCK